MKHYPPPSPSDLQPEISLRLDLEMPLPDGICCVRPIRRSDVFSNFSRISRVVLMYAGSDGKTDLHLPFVST